jgi:hypothetical protein
MHGGEKEHAALQSEVVVDEHRCVGHIVEEHDEECNLEGLVAN